jgi:hypothetical protein
MLEVAYKLKQLVDEFYELYISPANGYITDDKLIIEE